MYTTITPKEKNDIINYAFNKQAQASDTTKNTLIGALAGALGGSGVGYLSYLLTPKDKDENKSRKFWSHLLSGAAFGTMAGAGLGYYTGIKSDKNQAKSQNNGKGDVETATNGVVGLINKTPALRVPVETTIDAGVGAGGGWLTNKIVNHTDAKAIVDRSGTRPIMLNGRNINPLSSVEGRVALEKYYREHPDMGNTLFGDIPGDIKLDSGKTIKSLSADMPLTLYYINNANSRPTTFRAFKKLDQANLDGFITALELDGLLPSGSSATDKKTVKDTYKIFKTILQAQNRFNPNSKRNIFLRHINGKTLGATGALIGLLTGVFGGPSTGAAD